MFLARVVRWPTETAVARPWRLPQLYESAVCTGKCAVGTPKWLFFQRLAPKRRSRKAFLIKGGEGGRGAKTRRQIWPFCGFVRKSGA